MLMVLVGDKYKISMSHLKGFYTEPESPLILLSHSISIGFHCAIKMTYTFPSAKWHYYNLRGHISF